MESRPPLRHYEIFRRQLSAIREMRRVEPPLRLCAKVEDTFLGLLIETSLHVFR